MSAPRFFAPDLDPSGDDVVLSADESHHLARVLRLRAGDDLIVFDGRGRAWRARVVASDHRRATVRLGDALPADREPRVPLVIVQAILKGDGMDAVVRDATMAAVSRIVPIVAGRSQVRAASLERSRAEQRWTRIAVASAKQCGRARLPIIDPPREFTDWLRQPFDGIRLLLAEPEATGVQPRSLRDALSKRQSGAVATIIGPEGGWSIEECRAALDAGCIAVSLGTLTLRADAAGLVAASMISYALQEP